MDRPWLIVLTRFHKAPVFGRISLVVGSLGLYATAVTLVDRYALANWITVHSEFHALLGVVLGLLLVFRTNTAYDRWWEGRKLWGQLVNDSRNLSIKVHSCVGVDPAEKQILGRHLVAFAFGLKEHLRGGATLTELKGFEDAQSDPRHVPIWLVRGLYDQVEQWRQAKQIDGFELLFLDRHLASMLDICGACERIRKTPISKSYRWFVRQMIAIYLLSLPWGLIEDCGLWTIPTVVLIGYFMIGIESIAEDVEEPFGISADDLPLDDICNTIETSIGQILPRLASAGDSRHADDLIQPLAPDPRLTEN